MKNIPPLTTLKCFEAVSRLGGVSLAARELHVTHSAVSQQIRLLEEMLGVVLFVRESRALRLTEVGRLYALEIRSALHNISQSTSLAQARPQERELVIATLPSFAAHWLVPRLPRLQTCFPLYRIRLQTSLEIQDIGHGLADVGIRMGQGHWPELGHLPLFEDELLLVASPRFNAGQLPQNAREVIDAPLILDSDALWGEWCRLADVPESVSKCDLVGNDSNVMLQAVLSGQGVALERRSLVAAFLASGELVQLTDIVVPYPYPYWLVWPRRDVQSPKLLAFIAWIQAEVQEYLNLPLPSVTDLKRTPLAMLERPESAT